MAEGITMNVMTATANKPFRNATRQLTSVLAPLEKRCLIWMAERMPARINSDHLSALALVAMFATGAAYAFARVTPWAFLFVIAGLALNWFGDSLDGTLARVRHHERPRYGFYVDHVIDAIGAAFLLGGLGLSGYMSPMVALALLAAYLLVCVEVFLRTYCIGTFQMSFLKIGPTELRILLAIGTLFAWAHPTTTVLGERMLWFDLAGTIGAVGLVGTFIFSAVNGTRHLYAAEPLPGKNT
jgi:archaetidylinositol phosphate synthase